jgi:hypothetical protein
VDDAKNFELFRRAKLWLDCIPSEVLVSAVDQGLLVGRLGLYPTLITRSAGFAE